MSEPVLETIELSDFEEWLNDRRQWLQTAAKKIIDNKRLPNNNEIAELVRLCKLEAAEQITPEFQKVAPGSFSAGAIQRLVRIEELSEVFGVNAIKPGASLPFGEGNLTVIYGQNGSGKSGFARLIKQLCGSRSKDQIHPNVFNDDEYICQAKCQITIDGNPREIYWQLGDEPHSMLKYAQVFDSRTANQYMELTESSYEPSSMKFISRLIQISDIISKELKREKESLVSALPQFPEKLSDTDEEEWLSSLTATVSSEEIEQYCQFEKKLDDERIQGENLLSEKNISERLDAIEKQIVANKGIKQAMKSLKEGLSDEKAEELHEAKNLADSARKTANESVQQAFANAPLQGVGETAWRLMWEQARNYSVSHAYHNHEFPVTTEGSRCVLCQQELTDESAARLNSFETFVTAGLETSAKTAESKTRELIEKVVHLPSIEDWVARLISLQFDEATILTWYNSLNTRREQFLSCASVKDIIGFDWSQIDQAIAKQSEKLFADKARLTQLQQDGQRQQLEKRVKQLKAIQWLSQNKRAILDERERLVKVALLDEAIKLTATNLLTAKRTELAQTELDAGYQARFNKELKALGGRRLPVIPKSKSQGKGLITFGLDLVDVKRGGYTPKDILSEGETRVVALAAFLADTTGSNQLAPFIFDDPISSLDQDFEERVAARLIELSKTRQVIIFTHRLSLIALVEAVIKKHSENPANQKIKHIVRSLRRLDKVAGILAQRSLRDGRPDKAIKVVQNQVIPQLKKLQIQANADDYDSKAKNACTDFRIILERTVEFILLNDVVIRFRRDIMTKGKLSGIAKVSIEDCVFLDGLMTKYSVHEHSQPDDLSQSPVELQEFEEDVLELIKWMEEFKNR